MEKSTNGTILQRDKKTYAIVARVPMGIITPENLENMAKVARKYNVPTIKITSGQRIAFIGLKPEDIDIAWQELGMGIGPAEGPCIHYVQACPGSILCKFGQQESLGLARKLEMLYVGKENSIPAKTKIGISGCRLNCAESYLRDFGAFGTNKGWSIVAGGNSGGRPRIGDVMAEDLSEEQTLEFFRKCFEIYSRLANGKERMPNLIRRIGIEEFKKAVLE
jgi:NAD(P)H-nitrite reductase large subunit